MDNWSKLEFIFAFKLHIPPSEMERLEYYRIDGIFKEYEAHVERENKEYEKQNKQQKGSVPQMPKAPSMPNYGSFKTPKLDIPKFDMPKH